MVMGDFHRKSITECTLLDELMYAVQAVQPARNAYNSARKKMQDKGKDFRGGVPGLRGMLKIDAATGLLVSHTPRRASDVRDLETGAAMREQDERKESIFRQSSRRKRTRKTSREEVCRPCARQGRPRRKPLRDFDLIGPHRPMAILLRGWLLPCCAQPAI